MRLNLCSRLPPAQPGGQSHKSATCVGQYPPSSAGSSKPTSLAKTEMAESRIHTLGYRYSPRNAWCAEMPQEARSFAISQTVGRCAGAGLESVPSMAHPIGVHPTSTARTL
eukprot:6423896-Amphidinium_carterae.1